MQTSERITVLGDIIKGASLHNARVTQSRTLGTIATAASLSRASTAWLMCELTAPVDTGTALGTAVLSSTMGLASSITRSPATAAATRDVIEPCPIMTSWDNEGVTCGHRCDRWWQRLAARSQGAPSIPQAK